MALKPVSTIKANLGINPDGKAQRFLVDTCYRYIDKYVPMRDGDLRTVVSKTNDSITYEVPYAHAQYVGYTTGPVMNYTTPGTGPYWDRRMVSAEINDVCREVQQYIERG